VSYFRRDRSAKHVRRTIFQIRRQRLCPVLARFAKCLAIQSVIFSPVFKLFFDARADDHSLIGGIYGQIAVIEKPVQIAAEKKTIGDIVPLNERIGFDMRGFKR
jgi:hypothetical protein